MKIFIDFDGILLDTNDLVIKAVLDEIMSDGLNEIFEELEWDSLYKEAPIINDGINILKSYQDKLDITILTKIKHLNEGVAKYNYLREQGVKLPIVFVPINLSKAQIVRVRKNYLLIDDDLNNIREWRGAGGLTYHFKANSSLNILEDLQD